MHERFVCRDEAARDSQVSSLRARWCLESHCRADAPGVAAVALQPKEHAVAGSAGIAIDGHWLAEIGDDQVEIAVTIEVCQSRAVTRRNLIESPFFADAFESQVAQIAECQVRLSQDR